MSDFLREVGRLGVELNSMMLWRGGAVIAEGWWRPYAPHRPHMMHSATKSFLSAAVGMAIDEGYFALEDRVLDFFPEYAPAAPDANLAAMTVADLITQTSGHAHGTSGALWRSIKTSWITEFLKIAVPYVPGEKFRYSSATSFMLSAIITKTTGDNVHTFIRPRLLEPLGITDLAWDMGPENVNPGGNGASCTSADLLKLAILHHQRGCWNGRRILPEAWVAAAVSPQRGNPYGYHWWAGPRGAYYAYGVFGQFAFVFPAQDTILVTTAACPYGEETLRSLVWSYFPAILEMAPAADAALHDAALAQQLAGLSLLPAAVPTTSPLADAISGASFEADDNSDGVRSFGLTFAAGHCAFELHDEKGRHRIDVGMDDWLEGDTSMSGAALHHGYEPATLRVVAGGRWTEPAVFEMTWQFAETAFRDQVSLHFDAAGKTVTLRRAVNTNSASPIRPEITARRCT